VYREKWRNATIIYPIITFDFKEKTKFISIYFLELNYTSSIIICFFKWGRLDALWKNSGEFWVEL